MTEMEEEKYVDQSHHPHDEIGSGYDLPSDTVHLDLMNCRLKKIDNVSHLKSLKKLQLRQNLIKEMENVKDLESLEELDLYDNQIKLISLEVNNLKKLRKLDLSFNLIRKIINFDVPNEIQELYLVRNKITTIDGLEHFYKLRLLELGNNRIRDIPKFPARVEMSLTELYLGKNKIEKIGNLSNFKNLRVLSLQRNRITFIHGVDELHNLEELFLSENGITEINEGLFGLKKLRLLDLSNNNISKIENVETLEDMEEFWISENKIEDFKQLENLGKNGKLVSVYFGRNPISRDVQYKRKILLVLPNVNEIDGYDVLNKDALLGRTGEKI